MTDFRFESEKIDEPKIISEFSMDGYEKYRLKTSDLTIDLAIIELDDRNKEDYIKERKEEISTNKTEVPHPYKPEKDEKESDEKPVKFKEDSNHGTGMADPEFNLITESDQKIARYNYLVTWKTFKEQEKLVELEFYTKNQENEKLLKISEELQLSH